MKKLFGAVAAVALLAAAGSASAADILLYNTGVNNDGSVRTNGDSELHYQLISSPAPTNIRVATGLGEGYPIGPWLPDSSTSAWIGPTGTDLAGPIGDYVYRLTFDLTGFNASLAKITGRWSTDDGGVNIKINGSSTGQTSAAYSVWSSFQINSGFVAGINTLDFLVNNGGGPTGLRVELSGTAPSVNPPIAPVPEPATWAMMISGFGLAGATLRRRRPAAA